MAANIFIIHQLRKIVPNVIQFHCAVMVVESLFFSFRIIFRASYIFIVVVIVLGVNEPLE